MSRLVRQSSLPPRGTLLQERAGPPRTGRAAVASRPCPGPGVGRVGKKVSDIGRFSIFHHTPDLSTPEDRLEGKRLLKLG